MLQAIQEATNYIRSLIHEMPHTAIVLGSGLGNLVSDMDVIVEIPYCDIPYFPLSTVEGHAGKLVFGLLANKPILVMKGRFHYYEGYNMKEVTFPFRVMQQLGISHLLLSNAAGGLNPSFRVGDVMVITDHINMFPENPLRGNNEETLGVRFPDMSEAYDQKLRTFAEGIAKANNIPIQSGVYLGTPGPSYETPSECRFFRVIGADAVGMSTVPEVIVARHAGMRVAAFSVITNINNPDNMAKTSHEEVQVVANEAEPRLKFIIKELVKAIHG